MSGLTSPYYFARGVADQITMALDGSDLIPVVIFIF
jgi:hypothetical protein